MLLEVDPTDPQPPEQRPARLASMNKSLAWKNKSPDGAEATKRRSALAQESKMKSLFFTAAIAAMSIARGS